MKHTSLLLLTCLLLLAFAPLRAQDDTLPDATVIPMDTRLRLRDAPSFSSNTLDGIEPGTALTLVGRTADSNWLHIRTPDGVVGWVSAPFISVNVDLNDLSVTTNLDSLPHPLRLADNVAENVRAIFARGQELGNRADVFSKLGDSITVAPHMLTPLSDTAYNLGDFQYLEGIIERFSAEPARDEKSSFANVSMAAGIGWTTDAVLKSKFTDLEYCQLDEAALDCEYRLVKPAFALIMFGTNDVAHLSLETYTYNMGRIVKASIEQGVVPIISTIPVRVGYEEQTAKFNEGVVKVARRYSVPLWEYGAAMQPLPDHGLAPDGVHPSIPPNGYKGAADFRASNLYSGYVIRNLTALQILDAVVLAVEAEAG
ncbi:MAG: SH3 domain-containing protein [Chloroflexi bacterium]|nr:SH3 domain-containing protein [Chloroflexota bacterium]MCC6893216.1 SH3 domain-containing protein [Anaerolineae bacterium]